MRLSPALAAPLTFALLLVACDAANDKAAGEQAPRVRQTCADLPAQPEDADWPVKRPVAVPPALREIVSATATTLTIQTFGDKATCADIRGVDVSDLQAFAAERLVGYAFQGNEWYGYVVADRQVPGRLIETGDRPAFSPSAKRFAAVQVSGAGFGNLEGLGIWEAGNDGVRQLFLLPAMFIRGESPRIERWPDDTCVIASWVEEGAEPADVPDGADPWAKSPRTYIRVRHLGTGAELATVEAGARCADDPDGG